MRDREGQIVMAFGLKIDKPPSVVFGELLALSEGLQLVHDRRLEVHEVNSNSLPAVQTVAYPKEDFSYTLTLMQLLKM